MYQESLFLPILPEEGELHVRVVGRPAARALCLFHGAGADVSWRTWEPQMEAFGSVRRTYALDWPGWGQSSGRIAEGLQRYDPLPMVKVAIQALDVLNVDRADIGGVSWGALIALELALAEPTLVEKLVLVDAACRPEDVRSGRYAPIVQPAWLAWADEDPIVPVSLGHLIAESLPNCELHVFPGQTHWPHHLHAEAFNDEVVRFLTG